jgi:hypothetical protein
VPAVIDKGFRRFFRLPDLVQDIVGMTFTEMGANTTLTFMNTKHSISSPTRMMRLIDDPVKKR